MGRKRSVKKVKSKPSEPPMMTTSNIPELPNEVWRIVLDNLKGSYGSLLSCRLVSKDFKSLADEVLKDNSSLWKSTPTYEDFEDVLTRAKGVRFSTKEQVTTFISETKGLAWNPFPNGTVIFCPNPYLRTHAEAADKAYNDFYDAFFSLVSIYHEDIYSLVYCFKKTMDHIQLYAQLECILKLKKLKHLVIFSEGCFEYDDMEDFIRLDRNRPFIAASLSNIIEFQIIRDKKILMPYLVRVLCAAVNSSCKRLAIYPVDYQFLNPISDEAIFDFPKLEKIKTSMLKEHPSDWKKLIGHCRNASGLREVTCLIAQISASCMNRLMKFLEEAQPSLQLLFVEIAWTSFEDASNPNPVVKLAKGKALQFNKMEHLVLDYYAISKWKNLLPYFNGIFPNLKELTILVDQEDQGSKTPQEFRTFMMDLWKKLPSSLNVIHVPYFFWRLDRAESI